MSIHIVEKFLRKAIFRFQPMRIVSATSNTVRNTEVFILFIYIRNVQNALNTAKHLFSISGIRKLIILMILISDEDILTGMNQEIQIG